MAVQMTRAEYEATYGSKPPVAQPTQNAGPIRMTRAQYEATYGKSKTPVTPEKTFGQKVSGGIQKIFPGQKVGQAIGTLAGYALTPKENRKYYDTSAPSVGQVIGDVAQIALTVGTAGGVRTGLQGVSALGKASGVGSKLLNKATIETAKTVGGRAVQNTAIGAGFGATTGIKEGKDFKGVLKDTAIGAVTGLGTGLVLDGAISAYGAMKRTPIKEIAKTERELQRIENNYQKLRKNAKFSKDGNIATRNRVAKSGVLSDATDSTGTIITDKAIKRYRDLSPLNKTEGVVRNNLERLGETIDVDTLERKLIKSVYDSGQQGANLESSLNTIEKEIAGYRRRATPDGKIPLTLLHDAKIDVYNTIDFNTSAEIKAYKKTLAKGLKEAIEENSSFNVKEVNETLSPYLNDIRYLESLNGRKVKGGKLGKYSARIAGNIAGGIAGGSVGGFPGSAVGTIVGGEVGDIIQGKVLKNTFGSTPLTNLPESEILKKAVTTGNSPRLQLPAGRKEAPRVRLESGKTINLPSRTQSAVDAQSLANLKAQKIAPPSKIPSKVSISKSVAPKKLPSKPVAKTDSLLQEAKKYKSAEEFVKAAKEGKLTQETVKQLQSQKGGVWDNYQKSFEEYKKGGMNGEMPVPPTGKQLESQLTDIWNKANKPKLSLKDNRGFIASGYKNEGNLTTKILKDLEGKTTVSKQYILDATNRGELKQAERDITRQVLEDMTRGSDNPLIQEAKKYKSFDDFEKAFSRDIKRGHYWHITEDPNFKIDVNKGPRDMSSLAGGEIDKGKLMITSDLPYWAENYKGSRKYVAKIDMSDVSNSDFFQSERGMGNEFFVKNPKNAKVTKVIPMAEALKESKTFKSWLEKNVNSKEDLSKIYNQAQKSDTINVKEFADKVKSELLPLKTKEMINPRYEGTTLDGELRGNVKDYKEVVYESPIKTSAGDKHFPSYSSTSRRAGTDSAENYFGHTRIEDMADNKTRRVIEVQSDLYQKGNLEREYKTMPASERNGRKISEAIVAPDGTMHFDSPEFNKLKSDKNKLQQYNDPTAHFRMIREEIKKASQDGKTKLQFPTGETAMKIEGLGEVTQWTKLETDSQGLLGYKAEPDNIKIGDTIIQSGRNINSDSDYWIITDVLGDGKFKAVPKDRVGMAFEYGGGGLNSLQSDARGNMRPLSDWQETFDISGKVDTNNPIYKFYEKDVQKYLNKFGGKRVVDDKGVSWIEIPITKEQGINPVEAFGKIGMSPLFVGAGLGLAGVATAGTIKKKSIYKNGK